VKAIIIILIIDEDVNVKRRDEERIIINASSRQRCRSYIELEIIKNVVDETIHN